MYLEQTSRLALYAQNALGTGRTKTTEGILRYGKNPVVAVVDKSCAGRDLSEVLGIRHKAPIVDSVESARALNAEVLVIGTSNFGGTLEQSARDDILAALKAGMDIVSGMHDYLADDPAITDLAKKHGRRLFDVRRPPENDLPIASGKALTTKAKRTLTVGTDASIGKMTTSMELLQEAEKRGLPCKFIATGQTGIMISGSGICIDRVIGDFMAGAVEQMILEADRDCDYLFIEGQGAIGHPGFSGVTLSLLHGACPQTMVLVHQVSRKIMRNLPYPMPSLPDSIRSYEQMASLLAPSKVVAISLDTRGLDEAGALAAIKETSELTGLPANDPVRFGAANLLDAILAEENVKIDSHHNQPNRTLV
jgi:uncharacterized NAD-dependent epimerase/dehydratase family protein